MTYPYTYPTSQAPSPLGYAGTAGMPTADMLRFGAAPAPAPLGVPVTGAAPAGYQVTPFQYQAPAAGPTVPTGSAAHYPAPIGPAPAADAATEAKDLSMWDGAKGLIWDKEKGFNLDGLEMISKGIGTIGSIWGAVQQNKLANEMFDFQKQTYADNYANQIASYNTALQERADGRASQEGRGQAWANRYVAKNKI